jgi:hypothetical protein
MDRARATRGMPAGDCAHAQGRPGILPAALVPEAPRHRPGGPPTSRGLSVPPSAALEKSRPALPASFPSSRTPRVRKPTPSATLPALSRAWRRSFVRLKGLAPNTCASLRGVGGPKGGWGWGGATLKGPLWEGGRRKKGEVKGELGGKKETDRAEGVKGGAARSGAPSRTAPRRAKPQPAERGTRGSLTPAEFSHQSLPRPHAPTQAPALPERSGTPRPGRLPTLRPRASAGLGSPRRGPPGGRRPPGSGGPGRPAGLRG